MCGCDRVGLTDRRHIFSSSAPSYRPRRLDRHLVAINTQNTRKHSHPDGSRLDGPFACLWATAFFVSKEAQREIQRMEFEWDEAKRQSNIEKHHVDFAQADELFQGQWLEQEDMRYNYGEARWIALGLIGQRVYVCAFTRRNGSIRIISLRKGNSREQKIYYGTFS